MLGEFGRGRNPICGVRGKEAKMTGMGDEDFWSPVIGVQPKAWQV
jgi:hypothetical protein